MFFSSDLNLKDIRKIHEQFPHLFPSLFQVESFIPIDEAIVRGYNVSLPFSRTPLNYFSAALRTDEKCHRSVIPLRGAFGLVGGCSRK